MLNYNYADEYLNEYIEGYSRYPGRHLLLSDKMKMLKPVTCHLENIDQLKNEVLNKQVSLGQLRTYVELLSSVIRVHSQGGKELSISLANPKDLDLFFLSAGIGNIVLDIRRGDFGFPNYFLCESTKSWYRNYGVILSEFYTSFDYMMKGPRFVRLMHHGHEHFFIRMAPFRDKVQSLLYGNNITDSDTKTEEILLKIGEFFLQSAWHEDQEIAWDVVTNLFVMPKFRELMELVYFVLGTDFNIVSYHLTPDVVRFFELVYPHPSLVHILNRIESNDSSGLKETENQVRFFYGKMNNLFSEFLQTKICWGPGGKLCNVPFFRILYSNFSRSHLLNELKSHRHLTNAVRSLEEFSEETLHAILNIRVKKNHADNPI